MAQTPIEVDDRPLAVRRKRRSGSALVDYQPVPKVELDDACTGVSPEEAKTPSKRNKRVRFSDPGPSIAGPSSSTGLTPAMSRTSFAAFRPQSRSTPRIAPRLSLPNLRASSSNRLSPIPSPAPQTGEIQIMPWCDAIDNRTKRQIRRNHLSEVQNEHAAETKSTLKTKAQYEQELSGIKAQLSFLRRQQLHGETDGERNASKSFNRQRELEQEVSKLKQELEDRNTNEEPYLADVPPHQALTPSPTIIVDDLSDDNIDDSPSGLNEPLEYQAPIPETPRYAEASTQAFIRDPQETDMLREARLTLEQLIPGENALGLIPDDPRQLIDATLNHLRRLITTTAIAESEMDVARSAQSSMQKQFNSVIEQLGRARKHAGKVHEQREAERASAAAAQKKLTTLEADVEASSNRVRHLAKESSEKERTIQKLGSALTTYREEVGKLEALVTQTENENKTKLAEVRLEMDEAVADLECQVAAETVGRRDAEAQVEQKNVRIRELQARVQELLKTVNEKQAIIRDLEEAFKEERAGREQERAGREQERAGREQERAGRERAEHNARASDKRYELADQTREIIKRTLLQERDAATRTISALQQELKHVSKKFEGIADAHESDSRKRNAEVLEHKGLLTPTVGTRFRDMDEIDGMDGFVEVQRGKKARTSSKASSKKRDSGVVIPEEDEDEIMNDY